MWRDLFSGRERRRYIRLPIELKVDFKINGEDKVIPWHSGQTRDISLEGICLVTDLFSSKEWEEIEQNKKHFYLTLGLPGATEKIKAEAELERIELEAKIVWRGREKKEGKEVCLLGLQFTKIEKGSQEIIRRYIANNLISHYRPV